MSRHSRHKRRPSRQKAFNRRALFTGAAASGALITAFAMSGRDDGRSRFLAETAAAPEKADTLAYQRPDGPVPVMPPQRINYSSPAHSLGQTFGDLHLPSTRNPAMPVIVTVHGGSWTDTVDLEYMNLIARDLASYDVAVWNVEYRRVGSGGGWPTTVADICDAIDFIPSLNANSGGRLDLSRVAVVGHSAGGHLALWTAARDVLPDYLPGTKPVQRIRGVVTLAGLSDMFAAAARESQTTQRFLGATPSGNPARYHAASPVNHLPTGVPTAMFHGTADTVVPARQSEEYVRRAVEAGDDSTLHLIPGANHDPWSTADTEAWFDVRSELLRMVDLPADFSGRSRGSDSAAADTAPNDTAPAETTTAAAASRLARPAS